MQEKNNAVCSICNRPYYKCLSCKDIMNLSPWKLHTDTSEHYKVFQILRGYSTKVYSKDEAKSKLQMVDLSDFNDLRDNIKNVINEIIKENKKIEEEPIVEVESVNLSNKLNISENNLNDVYDKNINDNSVIEKSKSIRKRKSSEISEIVETE